jgi:hypothetical protein
VAVVATENGTAREEDAMTKFTVDEMMAFRPCYTRNRVAELWGQLEALDVPQILALDIPAAHRMWAVWRLLTREQAQHGLELIVTRAVMTHAVACGVPKVEAWALDWLRREDRSRTAAYSAAAYSAASAAYSAAADADAYSAADAASAAAYSAAAAAYSADAREAERLAQIADILTVLR